jgi:hypothetical protein
MYFKKTKTGSNRPGSVQFGFLGQNRFGSIFPVWLGFFLFFSVWIRFFRFQAYKIETTPNRSGFSKF